MSEPTLSTAFEDLRADLGHFAGYGRTPSAWNARQAEDVAAVLKTGQRQFYMAFDWSFLKPVATLTLAEGANTATLPDDYATADGPVMVGISGSSSGFRPLALGPHQPVYQMEVRQPETTGIPQYLCEEPVKGTSLNRGQRMRLRVWPIADQDYEFTFSYRLNANALDGTLPYAYGGAQHAQTLLQSCKAAWERDMDNIMKGTPQAAQQAAFEEMLEQSKMLDRRTKAKTVGYNRDNSDLKRRGRNFLPRPLLPVLVDGTLYD